MDDPVAKKPETQDDGVAKRERRVGIVLLVVAAGVIAFYAIIFAHWKASQAEFRSRRIHQLQQWHKLVLDTNGKVAVTGFSTKVNGDFMNFNGEISVPVDADKGQDALSRINGIFEARLSLNQRNQLKREWQPHRYSFYIAMTNGSAYMWKSVFSHTGREYSVSESCVSRRQVPSYVHEIAIAFLTPDPKLPVNASIQLVDESNEDSGSDGDSSTTEANPSSATQSSPTWLITGGDSLGHLAIRLQLAGDEDSFDLSNVSTPSMMLAGRERALLKCHPLFESAESDQQTADKGEDDDQRRTNDPNIPIPLRRWIETSFLSLPHEYKRRLNADSDQTGGGAGVSDPDVTQFMKSILGEEIGATEDDVVRDSPFGPVVNSTTCANGPKKCLFVHGIGVHRDIGLESNFTGYWGNQVMLALPCCSELKFTHFNTVDRPWYSPTLARATCAAAFAVVTNSTFRFPTEDATTNNSSNNTDHRKPLSDLVIISHSSGVMNVASMLMHGFCSLDHNSSMWIAIEGPILGSQTANHVVEDCNKPESDWDATVKTVLSTFDLCPVKKSTASFVRNGTTAAGPCLDELYKRVASTFRANVNASLCGVSPEGISSSDSPYYEAMSAYSDHEDPDENDGAVSFTSCRGGFPPDKYEPTYTSSFYKADLNHADGRLVHGDGWSKSQQPIRWLQRLLA